MRGVEDGAAQRGWARPWVIGLTGGIAAGKSTVAAMLRELGAAVVDADALAHDVVAPGTAVFAAVVGAFGRDVVAASGALDRAALAQRVFGEPAARGRLEAIVHPAIARAARDAISALARLGARRVVYDAALLVETGRHREVDLLIVVVADDRRRLRRLRRRDGLGAGAAAARLAAQLPQQQKRALADFVIDNSGARRATRRQVRALWTAIEAATAAPP
ncbi:MAG: dephospho-CoA kinase [Proteobacteria bacterium]|nr:dephospho-CoA kinase [Pseudomonadota bacterium]